MSCSEPRRIGGALLGGVLFCAALAFADTEKPTAKPTSPKPTAPSESVAGGSPKIALSPATPLAGKRLAITRDGLLKRDPVLWPGRSELVYTAEDPSSGRMRLFKMPFRPGSFPKAEYLHADLRESDRELCVSSDGAYYAFNIVRGLSSRLEVRSTSGKYRVKIPSIGVANWAHWPDLSPDGTTIVYNEGASPVLLYDHKKNPGKGGVVHLTPKGASFSDYMPRYSPDGSKILFSSRRDDDFEIYIMDADGKNAKRLTTQKGIDTRPSFSPDGRRIAFTSNRDGNYEIYVANVDGTGVVRVTNQPERDDHAIWHPDGRHLLYVAEVAGRYDLYLIEAPPPPPPSKRSPATKEAPVATR